MSLSGVYPAVKMQDMDSQWLTAYATELGGDIISDMLYNPSCITMLHIEAPGVPGALLLHATTPCMTLWMIEILGLMGSSLLVSRGYGQVVCLWHG